MKYTPSSVAAAIGAPVAAREVTGTGEGELEEEEGEGEGGMEVRVPRYDKSARGGRGDRAPEEEWEVVSARPEIVLLEGWMLGFEALPDGDPLLLPSPPGEKGGKGGKTKGENCAEETGEIIFVLVCCFVFFIIVFTNASAESVSSTD